MAPWCQPWFDEAIGSDYWESISIAARRDQVKVPALNIGGWHDIFLDGTLRNFAADSNPHSRLIVGPWGHDDFLTHLIGDRNLGVAGSGDGYGLFEKALDFYQAAVEGRASSLPRVSVYMLGARTWLELDTWPPPGAHRRRCRSRRPPSATIPTSCRRASAAARCAATPSAGRGGASVISAAWPHTPACGRWIWVLPPHMRLAGPVTAELHTRHPGSRPGRLGLHAVHARGRRRASEPV